MGTAMGAVSSEREVEIVAKAERRPFTVEYERRLLEQAERCTQVGKLGALLRRERLVYVSFGGVAPRVRGELGGRGGKKRGPRPQPWDGRDHRIAALERENRRLAGTRRAG